MVDQKLKLFCTVVETGSFSRAGEIIGLSQPGVSRQIQALEETYNAQLFIRSGGTVILTKAGLSLYKYAMEINQQFSTMNNEMTSLANPDTTKIKIGTCSMIGNYVMPKILAAFRRESPGITIDLTIDRSEAVANSVLNKSIDVAFIEGNVKKDNRTVYKKFYKDEIVVIMPSEHRWADKSKLSVRELISEPLVLGPEGCNCRGILKHTLEKNKISPNSLNIVLSTGTVESIKKAVSEGVGLSVVSSFAVMDKSGNGSLKMASIKENGFSMDYSLIYRKNRDYSSLSSKFLKFISDNPVQQILSS